MNWRLATIINGAIALITISAVIFDLTRSRPQHKASEVKGKSNTATNQTAETAAARREHPLENVSDIADVRVNDLGAVAAAELTQLMGRATPAELAALALKFNNLPIDGHTLGGLGVFFQAWTELDPKSALLGAFRLKDTTLRKLAANVVVNSVSPSAAPTLVTMLHDHPDKDLLAECKSSFMTPLVSGWALLDPEAAAKFVDDLGNTKSNFDYNARSKIAYAWGTLDPAAALQWVEREKGKEFIDGDSLYDQVVTGWCDRDLASASAYVEQHLSDDSASRAAVSTVATALFEHDSEGAGNWVARLPAGESRNYAESTLTSMWAEKDPAAAARWLATLPPDEQAANAFSIASSWVDNNWPEASRWLSSLTGEARDSALSGATQRDGATPAESLSLALSINDNERRTNVIQRIVRQWAAGDRAAAEIWIKGSSLSPEDQANLLSDIAESENQNAEVERVIIN
jgi:hypothetical protein